jgi:STE24 endopeptidase
LILLGVLSLPTAAAGHSIERRFGQSVQTWGSWAWDWTKGQLIALLLAIFLIWLLYVVIRRSARRWWLYVWLAFLPILVFLIFLEPLVFEPLFFRFTPLAATNPQLTLELERIVSRAGEQIPESHMYVMNASSKLNELNAYVTGIGASKRVVVWDTTIDRMSTPQILFVFGHEMGHYVLGHIPKGIAFAAALSLVFLFAAFHAIRWLVGRFGPAWKVRGVDDWASLPVLLLVLLIFDFAATPIGNAYSRHLEHQADQYGLEVVHGIVPDLPEVAAQSFQILGDVDLAEPSPSWAVKIWFYTHPSLDDRIRFARTYDPWTEGRSPEFVK